MNNENAIIPITQNNFKYKFSFESSIILKFSQRCEYIWSKDFYVQCDSYNSNRTSLLLFDMFELLLVKTGDPIFSTWKNRTIFSTSIFLILKRSDFRWRFWYFVGILKSGEIGIFKYFFTKIPFSPPTNRTLKIFGNCCFLNVIVKQRNWVSRPSKRRTVCWSGYQVKTEFFWG